MSWKPLLRRLGIIPSAKKRDYSQLRDFLLEELGIEATAVSGYEQALRHVTAANSGIESNERLEFIGDAVLDAVVAVYVYDRFPDQDEGFLSKVKSAIVNRQTLNKLARELQLEKWVKARVTNRKAVHVIGGNALEALIGAIFLDKGFPYTQDWVEEKIIGKLDMTKLTTTMKDAKSALYEVSHKMNVSLQFQVDTLNTAPEPTFVAQVIWNGEVLVSAESSSKKSAEQKASRKALAVLKPS